MKKYLSLMLMGMILSSTPLLANVETVGSSDDHSASIEKVDYKEMRKQHLKQKHRENFVKRLNLTEEQQKRASEIREKTKPQMEEIFSKMKELRKKADEIRKNNQKEFEDLLTIEQKEELKKMKTEIKEKRRIKKHKNN